MVDINRTCLHFTWNQKPNDSEGIMRKIDRVMGNVELLHDWSGLLAIFQPYRIFDHTLTMLQIEM